MTTLHAAAAEQGARSTRRWLAVAFLASAQFIVVLDSSIVNIALPIIGTQLHMANTTLAWVVTAYVLPFGALLLLGGRLADRYGHRRMFLGGTIGFVIGSAVAGLSGSGGLLLAARALQGASAAVLAPAALSLVTLLFIDAGERGKAIGIWGGVAGIGAGAGVLLGGVLTAAFGWQSVFFINVPIGIIAVAATAVLITPDTPHRGGRLDVAGAAMITAAIVAAIGALSALERTGNAGPLPIGLAVATVLLATGFVMIERKMPAPLVPLRIFRNRNLRIGNVVMLLLGGAMVAVFYALALFMGQVLGYSALVIGLSQLPLASTLVVIAGIAPTIIRHVGARATTAGSLALLAGGLVWLAAAPPDAHFSSQLLGPTVIIGFGIGGAFVTATQLAMHGAHSDETGLASGLVNTSQQIGGALGISLLGAVASSHTAALASSGSAKADALTSGFSWLFLGAAAFAVIGALAAVMARYDE